VAATLHPLQQKHALCLQKMLALLHPHLDEPRNLSKSQLATLRGVVCQMALQLMKAGAPGMAELHDRYSPQTLAQIKRAQAQALRQEFSAWLGEDFHQADECHDPDAVLSEAVAQWQASKAEKQAKRQAKTEARNAKRQAANPLQQLGADAEHDAHAFLRQLYRQLASALHPDRATDEAERQRKNTLMGEANAAYERNDLLALLRLQLQAELVAPLPLGSAPDKRLHSMTLLLKQQAAALERQRQAEQQRWTRLLGLDWGSPLLAELLQSRLLAETEQLQRTLADAEAALTQIRELPTLKAWLNHQRGMAAPTPDGLG
jgi:hypothetical protein